MYSGTNESDQIVRLVLSGSVFFLKVSGQASVELLKFISAAGRKKSHWSWFIIPQIAGLGRTYMSQKYAINSIEEARAFLEHPYLGTNIRKIAEVLLTLETSDATAVMGYPDDMKLRSSMTLFLEAAPEADVFQKVLDKYFDGIKDQKTLDILGAKQ